MDQTKIDTIQKAKKNACELQAHGEELVRIAQKLLLHLRIAELWPEIMGSKENLSIRTTSHDMWVYHGDEKRCLTRREKKYVETGVWK